MATIKAVIYWGSNHFSLPRVIDVVLSDGRTLPRGHVKLEKIKWLRRLCKWNDEQVDAVGISLGAAKIACEPSAARPHHKWEFSDPRLLKRAVLADPSTVQTAFAAPKEPRTGNWRSKAYEGGWSPYDEDADEAIFGPH